MKNHVITAGPSAGKTSTIRELSARGYRTSPEGARIVLDQLVSEGIEPKEFREENGQEYQERVIEVDLRVENNTPEDEVVFMDRSVVDNFAYARLTDREVSEDLWDQCKDKYGLVFRLDQLSFEDDYARTEDEKLSTKIHSELGSIYQELGYEVIDIPVMPVDERADLIE